MGPLTRLGVVANVLATIVIGAWGLLVLPEVVPTHFRTDGTPDTYGSRWSLLAVGLIGLAVVGLFVGLSAWCAGRGSLGSINVPHKADWLPEHEDELRRLLAADMGLFALAVGVAITGLFAGSVQAALDGSGLPGWAMALGAAGLVATLGLAARMATGRYRPPS